MRRTHTIHKISTTKKGLKRPKSVRILLLTHVAGVTRIELASAVLETVALPLCYTPSALCYYYINILNNHYFLLIFLRINQNIVFISQSNSEIWLMVY